MQATYCLNLSFNFRGIVHLVYIGGDCLHGPIQHLGDEEEGAYYQQFFLKLVETFFQRFVCIVF